MENLKPKIRPQSLQGQTFKTKTGCGNLYITINHDEIGMFEVFAQLGKTGGCPASQIEAIARLVSLCLRLGGDVKEIIDQLKGLRCPMPMIIEERQVLSCADAIGKSIEEYIKLQEIKNETK